MPNFRRLAAPGLVAAALALALPAEARVDYPGSNPTDWDTPHHDNAAAVPGHGVIDSGPQIVIVQHQSSGYGYDYPYGYVDCPVNCRTNGFYSNADNTGALLDHAHAFASGAFRANAPNVRFFFGR